MSSLLQRVDDPGDAELISAVRGGDADAYAELFSRHVEAARRLARQLVSAGDVDDLVSEAFAKVLVVLQRGGGPDLAFRAYLLTAVRRLHVDRIRANARLVTTDDLTPFDPGVPFRDTAVEGFESAAAARAFSSLPERWQMVLWHTEVEGQRPADVAPLLGMSANSVAALAYRAREGLREAFLAMHVQEVEDDRCTWTHRNLGGYVRGGISRRDAGKVERHLEECRACTAIHLELSEVNSRLSGILAPLLLGGAAAGYLGGAAGMAAKGTLVLLADRAKDFVLAHAHASAVAGVAATAVVGGAAFLALDTDRPARPDSPASAPATTATDAARQQLGRAATARSDDGAPRPAGVEATGEVRSVDATAPGALPTATPPPPEGPAPQPEPQPQPDPQPEPEPTVEVTATARAQGAGTFVVVVAVSGADDGATMTISGRGSAAVLTLDARCGPVGLGSGSCRVPPGTATYRFEAAAPLGAMLLFTVDGVTDSVALED